MRDVRVLVSLKDEKNNVMNDTVLAQRTCVSKNNFQVTISVMLPRSECRFTLSIFFKSEESNSYNQSRNYSLQWTAKNQREGRHYCNFSPPKHCDAYLFEPTLKELQLSKPHNFKIQIQGAIDVALVDSANSWYHFQRDVLSEADDIWIYEQFVPKMKGDCKVYAKFNLNENFSYICSYTAI